MGRVDAGGTAPGYTSPPGSIYYTQDAKDILQIQSFASLRSLSLRQEGACQILQSSCKLTFMAERPPPPQIVQQELLMAAEERSEYF